MKKISLLLVVTISLIASLKAQQAGDTIVIESFNYTQTYGINQWSPGMRDTVIDFSVLPDVPIEKVLMLYNMRCKDNKVSNFQNRDQGCGEWDASCNTYLHDSTRVDSLLNTHPDFTVSNFSGTSFDYTTQGVYDYYLYEQENIIVNSVSNEASFQISNGNLTDNESLNGSQYSGKSQFLYTASELTSAGFSAGEIDGLELESTNTSSISFLKINIKHTSLTELDPKNPSLNGFTEVFNYNHNFVNGSNKIIFSAPFVWNGVDNLIIEFSFTNSTSTSAVELLAENSSNNSIYANNGYSADFTGHVGVEIPVDSLSSISDEISISCWVNGHADLLPSNTSVFEAYDENDNRTLNVHLPWSNSRMYFDCGNTSNSYDRIDKEANTNEIEGQWNHWAFTKNTTTGEMKIYLNGTLWHSGNEKTKPVNISKMIVGNGINLNYNYKGLIDELRIWNKELTETEINDWKNISIDNSHPNFNKLVAYYKFDEGTDTIINDDANGLMANAPNSSIWNNTRGNKLNRFFTSNTKRPKLALVRGDYSINTTTITTADSVLQNPHVVREYTIIQNNGIFEDDEVVVVSENSYWGTLSTVYNGDSGQEISSSNVNAEGTINIETLEYFGRYPSQIGIMSFVTPYGLGLDLGPEGKTWTFDMTDYLPIFKGKRRMTMNGGGQWMEDMDIKFLFILGTPPRDVLDFRQIWRPTHRSHGLIESDRYFAPRDVSLHPDGKYFKIRSAITGHGQEGEFIPRQHFINLNGGSTEFYWQVWKECADNPIYPQGGTWIYDRAGWCPGAPTNVEQLDITAQVSNNFQVNIDYGVLNASGTSDYTVNNQIVTYGEINHSLDASVVEVIEPSNRVEFSRFNSICHTPKVVIKNTGQTELTSLTIQYWINDAPNPHIYNWSGSLEFDKSEIVNLPSPLSLWSAVNSSGNVFHVEVTSPNGGADEYIHNNFYHSKFEIPAVLPEEIVIFFKTNNAANESSYKIIDSEGNSVLTRSGMTNGTLYRDTILLEYGCYTFRVNDTGDDGIDFWANNDGNGYCRIFKVGGNLVKTFEPDFGDNINFNFTVGSPLKYEDLYETSSISVYPNPVDNIFVVEGKEIEKAEITILDSQGRKVDLPFDVSKNKITMNAGLLSKGIYLIQINGDNINESKRIILN